MADDSNGADMFDGSRDDSKYDAKTQEYIQELLREKHLLNTSAYPHASRLLHEEIVRAQQTGRMTKDFRYADVYREKPIKAICKVAVPVKEHPKFNFVGKLLGPKGNTLKRLQEETLCRMSILGRGSMKDKMKEEELRNSLDPKFAHLSDDLHVEICALAVPAEAHARLAYALAEIRKYLIPDNNDDISHGQLREMGNYAEDEDSVPPYKRPLLRTPRGGGGRGGRGSSGRGGGSGGRPQWGGQSSMGKSIMEKTMPDYDYGFRSGGNNDYYNQSEPSYGSGEMNQGRWKPSSMPGLARYNPRSTPYNRPQKFN